MLNTYSPSAQRSFKLKVKNENTYLQHYVVEVTEVRSNPNGLDRKKVAEFVTKDPRAVYSFMANAGVPSAEVSAAAGAMEQNGHNVANFGWLGSFMFTEFEGVMQ